MSIKSRSSLLASALLVTAAALASSGFLTLRSQGPSAVEVDGLAAPLESATLRTDRTHYAPGEVVIFTSSGWAPGETVTLVIHEEPPIHPDRTLVGVADSSGELFENRFLAHAHDRLVAYSVTAKGEDSGLSALAAFGNTSVNLDQCANGVAGNVPCTGGAWQNGNLNSNQAKYLEGDSIPYRDVFTGVSANVTYTKTISWDTTKSGKHAIDYLTNWDRSVSGNPCSGVLDPCPASPDLFPIPPDSNLSATGGFTGTQVPGSFRCYGCDITEVGGYTRSGSYADDSTTSVTITFTATGPNAVLAWGGHISHRRDWGAANTAVTISGSPYHMADVEFTCQPGRCSTGKQDRSVSAEAVIFPAKITVVKNTEPDSADDFGFTTAGGLTPPTFSLDDDADGLLSNTRVFSPITTFGQYTVTESDPAPFALTGLTCTDDVTGFAVGSSSLGTRTATIPLAEGQFVTCTFTNTSPAECDGDEDCAAGEVCDVAGGGDCVDCLDSSDCTAAAPVCNTETNTCGDCTTDAQCASFAGTPACSAEGTCVECLTSDDCSTGEPVCNTNNECVPCTADAQCGADEVCNVAEGTCVDCLTSDDCTTGEPVCNTNNECVPCTADAQCGADEVCNVAEGTCVDCLTSDDCTTGEPVCNTNNECVPCTADAQCGADEVCNVAEGTCVDCLTSDDCTTGEPVCNTNNECVPCTADAQCGADEVCNVAEGTCVDCLTSDDCTTGEPVCNTNNECVPCTADAQCGADEVCNVAEGTCVDCLTSDDCTTGEPVCNTNNECVPCTADAQCGADEVCNVAEGTCVDCLTSDDCSTGEPVCNTNNECVPCTADAQCGADEVCNVAEGTCVDCLTSDDCSTGEPVCNTNNECVPCTADAQCGADEVCNVAGGGTCVDCLDSSDCTAAAPVCNTETNTCGDCTTDAQCASFAGTPACSAEGTCVECQTSDDCSTGEPVCNTNNECVPCTADAQCGADEVCNVAEGTCVDCLDSSDCTAAAPVCNTETNTCGDCTTDAQCASFAGTPACSAEGTCVECQTSDDCSTGEPVCNANNECVPCTADAQCGADEVCNVAGGGTCVDCLDSSDCTAAAPVCNTETNTCGDCTTDAQCASFAGTPACSAEGTCVECQTSDDCSTGEPVCNTNNECVPCTADAQCGADEVCNVAGGGTCVDCLTSDDCSTGEPVCNTNNECGPCTSDDHCDDPAAPECSTAGICVECNGDEDCPGGFCGPAGSCFTVPSQGKIAPTATTCEMFRVGTAGDLTTILYGVKADKINNVAPGVLFYYTYLSDLSAGTNVIRVDQTKLLTDGSPETPFFGVHKSQVSLYNASDCTTSTLRPTIATGTSGEAVTINLSGVSAGQDLIVGIKYNPGSVVGTVVGAILPVVHYNFETSLNDTPVQTDPDGLDLRPKP